MIVPGATHTDLYDGSDHDYIPFAKINKFFKKKLATKFWSQAFLNAIFHRSNVWEFQRREDYGTAHHNQGHNQQ